MTGRSLPRPMGPKGGRRHRRVMATRTSVSGHGPLVRVTPGARAAAMAGPDQASRGQVLVIFAGALVTMMVLCALVVDVAWYWSMNLRIQRAADAAALAGVVFLPGNPEEADVVAKAEAAKNGFTDKVAGVHIATAPDAANDRRLEVTIDAPVGTFFARVIGIDHFPAKREAKADYVQPVPMGSPDQYYGVGYWVKTDTSTTTVQGDSDWHRATSSTGSGWQTDGAASVQLALQANDGSHAVSSADGATVTLGGFGLSGAGGVVPNPAANQTLTLDSIQVRLSDAFVSAACPNANIGVELAWTTLGNVWSSRLQTPDLGTSTSPAAMTLGGDPALWGTNPWRGPTTASDLRLRLTSLKGCSVSFAQLKLDELEVRARWTVATTITQI